MAQEKVVLAYSGGLDTTAIIPWLKEKSHLPIIVDPSHATGIRELVLPMSMAATAAGAAAAGAAALSASIT